MDGSNIFRDIIALLAIVLVCWYLVWKGLPKLLSLVT
jgi:F0F1-type ATP synthase membrane subunit b/b'